MCARTLKLTVSLSEELCDAINDLSRQLSLSKSRLVETLLRENPTVRKGVGRMRAETQMACRLCGIKLDQDKVRINTPKHGVICARCWAKEMGKFVEENPISDA